MIKDKKAPCVPSPMIEVQPAGGWVAAILGMAFLSSAVLGVTALLAVLRWLFP
ncbi:hypothetical protein [Xenophilus azovorans]|uniref:hypothetical protein n=1 Tax=Xenophilus azovorans TaxID=151755 RepID=UPI0012EE661A|nr:hypothetical protein [Xenophilus azovorans]